MEAIRSPETSVHKRSTRRHIPEDGILQGHRRENLKSYIVISVCRNPFLYVTMQISVRELQLPRKKFQTKFTGTLVDYLNTKFHICISNEYSVTAIYK
jgi:hypothetical protein